MSISLLRDASKNTKNVTTNNLDVKYGLSSASNFLFYGSGNGKSTLALTQINPDEQPILVISAAGGSIYLKSRYPNVIFKTAATIDELEVILSDLEANYKLLQTIQRYVDSPKEMEMFKEKVFLPTYYKGNEAVGKEDLAYLESLAKSNKFIFSRIVLEECDVISQMIESKIEDVFNVEILGDDKSKRGRDWNVLSKEFVAYYSRWLRLPCITILSTTDKLPGEKEGLKQIIPSLCTGSGQRLLTSMIGNVLYIGNDATSYFIQVKPDTSAFVRTKFYNLKTDFSKIPVRVDVTNKPEEFWIFIEDCKSGVYDLQESKK